MNIIILNDYAYVNGGAGQIALSTANSLSEKGHNVLVFSSVGSANDDAPNFKHISLNQYDILNDPNRLRAIIQGIWNKESARKFDKILNNMDPKETIIHVHTISKAISSSVIKVATKYKFKVIYHLHDYGIVCPNLGFYHYGKQEICTLKPLSLSCLCTNCDSRSYPHKIWRSLRQAVQLTVGNLPRGISDFIAVSNFSKEILKPFLPKDASIHLLKNPIDVEKNEPIKVKDNSNFVFVGRLSKEKDPVLLAKATKDLNINILFVGDGDCSSEIKLTNPNAEITGWVDRQQVFTYLSNARVLVLTSRLYETQGMVVSEAAALGIPAIVPDTSAARDFIINGKTGLIFKSGDINDLKEKIQMFVTNDRMVIEMGRNAYDYFWDSPPTMDYYIKELESLYKGILER